MTVGLTHEIKSMTEKDQEIAKKKCGRSMETKEIVLRSPVIEEKIQKSLRKI